MKWAGGGQALRWPAAHRHDAASSAARPARDRLRPPWQRLCLWRVPPGEWRCIHLDRDAPDHRQFGRVPGADRRLDRSRRRAGLRHPRPSERHRATDVLFFSLAHPRWEFVFQPTYAAYLNLIEPWWKILRSLALKGKRFETWEQIASAVSAATTYWNAHCHPFVWGRRRRHRPRRQPGIALLPSVA